MRVRLLVKVMKPDLVTVKARVVGNTSCTVTTARPLPSVTAHCSNFNVKASVSSSIGTPSKLILIGEQITHCQLPCLSDLR